MNRPDLGQWTFIFTYNQLDIYGYGCLRIGIDRLTGDQVLGYIREGKWNQNVSRN